jgi:hypothetical protein
LVGFVIDSSRSHAKYVMISLNESLNDNVLGSREATARISSIDKADGPAALDTAPARHSCCCRRVH